MFLLKGLLNFLIYCVCLFPKIWYNYEIKKKKSSTGNKVRLKGETVIYHQGLYSLGHFAVMLEVSRIPSAYGVQESKSKKKENSSLKSEV